MEDPGTTSIRRCPKHGIDCVLFCTRCKKLVCDECKGCSDHEIVLILDMLDNIRMNFFHIPIDEYIKQSKIALAKFTDEKEEHEKKLAETTKERDGLIEKIKGSRENKKKDLELIKKTVSFLNEVQDEYISDVLKLKCSESKDLFDVGRILEREINEFSKNLIRLNSLVETLHHKLNKICVNVERLKILSNMQGSDISSICNDDDILLSITLLRGKGIFEEAHSINTTVDKYNAFTGANLLKEIEDVHKEELVEVEKGIRMTKPVPFRRINVMGTRLFASLSHNGVFCCYSDDTKTVSLINMCDYDRICIVPFENKTIAGFYDDKVMFLTTECHLRESNVNELFERPTKDTLLVMEESCEVNFWTDVSLLHSTRSLVYRSTDNVVYEYNVDTRENLKLFNNKIVQSIGNMTGINMNIKTIYDERVKSVKNVTCASSKDNVSNVIFEHDAMCFLLVAVIPSTSEPENMAKAMKMYNHLMPEEGGGFNINTKQKVDSITPSKSTEYQTIVRLYRDIFIMHDSSTSQWVLVRINVD